MPPPGTRFLHTVATTFPALSPDGTQLAFIALAPPRSTAIWLRPIAGLDARLLPGTEGASSMFWSPDGREIAFFAGGSIETDQCRRRGRDHDLPRPGGTVQWYVEQ